MFYVFNDLTLANKQRNPTRGRDWPSDLLDRVVRGEFDWWHEVVTATVARHVLEECAYGRVLDPTFCQGVEERPADVCLGRLAVKQPLLVSTHQLPLLGRRRRTYRGSGQPGWSRRVQFLHSVVSRCVVIQHGISVWNYSWYFTFNFMADLLN